MKITIVEDPNVNETEISIVCAKMTDEIKNIVSNISTVGLTFMGRKENETFIVPIDDIFYFESVDGMLSIKKAENSRLVATLKNKEKLVVSRQYVTEIKRKLGV